MTRSNPNPEMATGRARSLFYIRIGLSRLLRPVTVLLAATLLTAMANAQERPLPPTRIILPSDSLVARNAAQKLEAESSRIELPEVVVLGQDRAVRQVESKRGSLSDKPRLLKPDYETLSIFGRRDNSRPLANDAAAARNRLIWAGASAGSFASAAADAGFSGKFPWGSARVSGWLDRSDGAFRNSQHADGGLAATATTPLQPRLHGRTQAELSWLSRGAHGAVHPDLDRRANQGYWLGEADYAIDGLSTARAGLRLAGAGVTSDTSGLRWRHTGDFILGLNGDYMRQMERFTLRGSASYSRESLSPDSDSLDAVAGFGQIRAEVQMSLLRSLQLTAALGYQSCSADSGDAGRFAPSLQLALVPGNRWGITLFAWSGLRYLSFSDRLLENPYLSHSPSLAADDSPLSLQLRADFKPVAAILLQAGIYRGQFNALHYWQRDQATGLLGLRRVADVDLTELQFGGRIALAAGMMLQGDLRLNSDHLKKMTAMGRNDRIPYRPDYNAKVSLALPLPWELQLNSELEMIGERRRGLDEEGRLPKYILLNAAMSRKLGRYFSAQAAVKNIFDRDYVIWEGYDEPGIQFLAGLKWVY